MPHASLKTFMSTHRFKLTRLSLSALLLSAAPLALAQTPPAPPTPPAVVAPANAPEAPQESHTSKKVITSKITENGVTEAERYEIITENGVEKAYKVDADGRRTPVDMSVVNAIYGDVSTPPVPPQPNGAEIEANRSVKKHVRIVRASDGEAPQHHTQVWVNHDGQTEVLSESDVNVWVHSDGETQDGEMPKRFIMKQMGENGHETVQTFVFNGKHFDGIDFNGDDMSPEEFEAMIESRIDRQMDGKTIKIIELDIDEIETMVDAERLEHRIEGQMSDVKIRLDVAQDMLDSLSRDGNLNAAAREQITTARKALEQARASLESE